MSNAASPIVMMLVMFAIFYFILIRPQAKRQKEHQAMLGKLGKGDEVITRGGMIGLARRDSSTMKNTKRATAAPRIPNVCAESQPYVVAVTTP